MAATDTVVSEPLLDIPGYTPISELGHGGMATVYLAIQECFGRKVALKVMAPALAADPTFSERFLREAKIVARLSHPHIVAVFDVGAVNDHHYIAMEYHAGGDLKSRIANGIHTDESLLIAKQIAMALDYAHSKGYIHRDVKPDNILFREDGGAILTDFGIARPTKSSQEMTQAGKVVGTPKYMSPEQAKGMELDARADLYALGVLLFEMLTGHVPYDGNDPIAIGIKHLKNQIPELPEDVAIFQPIIDKLMAKEPQQRFQRGQEVVDALELIEMNHQGGVVRAKIDTISARTPSSERNRIRIHAESIRADIKQQADSTQGTGAMLTIALTVFLLLAGAVTSVILAPQLFPTVETLMSLNQQFFAHDRKPTTITETTQTSRQPQFAEVIPNPNTASLSTDNNPTDTPLTQDANATHEKITAPEPAIATDKSVHIEDRSQSVGPQSDDSVMGKINIVAKGKATQSDEQIGDEQTGDSAQNEISSTNVDTTPLSVRTEKATEQASTPIDPTIAAIEKLLSEANEALNQQRLSKPPGDSALDKYRAILALSPDNEEAKQGIQAIANKYLDLSQRAIDKEQPGAAKTFLAQAQSISSNITDVKLRQKSIIQLEKRLAAKRAEELKKQKLAAAQKREQDNADNADNLLNKARIGGLLRSAQNAFDRNHLTSPSENSALAKYQQALTLDKNNSPARQGIKKISEKLIKQTQQAVDSGDYVNAKALLVEAIKVNPNDGRIDQLREAVQEAGI